MVTKRLSKVTQFPRPHNQTLAFTLSTVDAGQGATIIPFIHNDEGLGSPSSYNANPAHASFAATQETNCYPESRIYKGHFSLKLSLTKHCWNTDKIEAAKVLILPIAMSYDDALAQNTDTTDEVQDILEMQRETTDKQSYPLYNSTDLAGDYITMSANLPGLTTDTKLEGIDFNADTLYDAIQYYTNGKKLLSCIGKPLWATVKRGQSKVYRIPLPSKAKAINDYTFFGCLVYVPPPSTATQIFESGDDSAGDHILVNSLARYNEWHELFNAEKT